MTDLAMIQRTTEVFFAPGTVAEVRILYTPRAGTVSGYFDDFTQLAQAAQPWSGKVPGVYVTLNPCTPSLLARAANRLKERVKTTTGDTDILSRTWLPLDFDPVRPADISATDAEHEAALARADACAAWLTERGWPAPVEADSGNGAHRLYAIDLPNDTVTRDLLERCLKAIELYFSDDSVALDVKVFNAGRIWKLYGTMACKGDDMPDRPHRLSRLLHVPTPITRVSMAQLASLAVLSPAPPHSGARPGTPNAGAFDLASWIVAHGLPVVSEGPWQQTGYRWVLNPCPWNSDHTNKAAFVVRLPSGAIAAGCQHNGCSGHTWESLRQQYEPEWTPMRERQQAPPPSRRDTQPLNSLNSLNSQHATKTVPPITTPENDLNSPFSLNSQPSIKISEEAYYGLAGQVVRAIEPHTESDPVALLGQFLNYFGVVVGRTPYFQVESTRHYPNVFVTLVGDTSKARKGTSYDRVESIMRTVDSSWARANIISGCGSGEGLIHAVRDPTFKQEPIKTKGKVTGYEDVMTDPGIIDKRLLVYEAEFASVLKVCTREGNILSMTLRQAWDSGYLHNTVKTAPQRASNAHIAVIGHITTEELRKLMTTTEAANGFGNRFLWLYVKRSKSLPDGGNFSSVNLQSLVEALRAAHRVARDTGRMTRDKEATAAWHAVYPALSEGKPGLSGAMMARGEAQVLRLSMLYALLDCSAVIRAPHVYAALALWEYVEASIAQVFGATTGNREADTLREALKGAPKGKMTKTEIISEVFHRHIKAHELNEAIRVLVDLGWVSREFEATEGRRKEYICYDGVTNSTTLTRTRTHLVVLARQAVDQQHATDDAYDSLPCELSEKGELSQFRGLDTDGSASDDDCELSELSELSPLPLSPDEEFDILFEEHQQAAEDANMQQALGALETQGRASPAPKQQAQACPECHCTNLLELGAYRKCPLCRWKGRLDADALL